MSLVMGLYETLTGLEFIRQFPVGLRVAICSRVTLRRMAKGTKVVMSEDISTNPLFLLVQGHARVPKLPLLGSGDTFGYRRYARGEGDAGDGIARNGRVVVVVTEALCVELAPATCAALFGGLGQSICWAPEIARAILREPRERSEDEISLVQALVSDMPFFRAQSSELRHAVTRRIALEKVRAGAVAHSWSGPCDRIFVVLSGSFAVRLSADGAQWNGTSQTPYFYYRNGTRLFRVDHEDARSLTLKSQLARRRGVRGVAMWHADFIDYANASEVAEFWRPLRAFV